MGWINAHFPIGLRVEEVKGTDGVALTKMIVERIQKAYSVKESVELPEALGALERYVVINSIDHHWQEHLTEMEELRKAIGLRSYGQVDPLVAYKSEAYGYFEEMMNNVRLQICTGLFRSASNLESFENMLSILARSARTQGPENAPAAPAAPPPPPAAAAPAAPPPPEAEIQLPKISVRRDAPKVGRNDPCPCGSGKKYKHCHGA